MGTLNFKLTSLRNYMKELEDEHATPFGAPLKDMLGSQIMSSLPADVMQQFQLSTKALYPNLDKIFDKANIVIRTLNSRISQVNSESTKKNNSNNSSNLSTISYVSGTNTTSSGTGPNSSSCTSGSGSTKH